MTKRRIVAILVIFVFCVGASALKMRRVQWSADAQVLSNSHEVFLFIGEKPLGWRLSYLRLAGELALALIGDASANPDLRSAGPIVVFEITAKGTERYTLDNAEALNISTPHFNVLEGQIYYGPGWRWTGQKLERTSMTEERRLAPLMRAGPIPFSDYSDRDGWSNRVFVPLSGPPEGTKLTFDLDGQRVVLSVRGDSTATVDVDVQRANDPIEKLYSLDGRSRSVSEAQYEATFHRRS